MCGIGKQTTDRNGVNIGRACTPELTTRASWQSGAGRRPLLAIHANRWGIGGAVLAEQAGPIALDLSLDVLRRSGVVNDCIGMWSLFVQRFLCGSTRVKFRITQPRTRARARRISGISIDEHDSVAKFVPSGFEHHGRVEYRHIVPRLHAILVADRLARQGASRLGLRFQVGQLLPEPPSISGCVSFSRNARSSAPCGVARTPCVLPRARSMLPRRSKVPVAACSPADNTSAPQRALIAASASGVRNTSCPIWSPSNR